MPQLEAYERLKDPLNHPETFKTLMHLQGVPDEIMFRAFPITLKGPKKVWFSSLSSNIISTFKELSRHFITHFIGGQRYKRSSASLLNIKQREDESLRSYVTWFNKEALLIERPMTRFWLHLLPMGSNLENFFFPFTRMTGGQWLTCSTRPLSI